MYNIHSHYFNLFSFAQTILTHPRLEYLYPFGASSIENIELLDTPNSLDKDPIIFCYDQEPLLPGYNDALFLKVAMYSERLHRPVILVTTERDSEALNYFVNKYKFIPCYCFFHIFAAHDWYRGYQYDSKIIPVPERTVKKKFISFNRLTGSARVYRSLLVGELAKRNLLDQGYVSYSDTCPEHGHYQTTLDYAISEYRVDPVYVEEIKSELDKLDHPLRIDHKEKSAIPNHSMVLSAVPECMESFVYVVTETCFWETKCHLTEKVFKPIILRQPFILVGCAYNLEYLKSYGFKTFDRWFDESYDKITDPILRLQAVADLLKSICSRSETELTEMLHEMTEVLEHNYRLFNSREFLDSAWNELTGNLKAAIESAPVLQPYNIPRTERWDALVSTPTDFIPSTFVDKVQESVKG
jgi:hypothetical protein